MSLLISVIAILIAYLFGSIPMGYLVARLYGIDVTQSGSGRIGGTNVLRAAGAPAAGLTVLGDLLKGLIPIYFIVILGHPLTSALAASATVIGHNYSIFLRFRGGVGAGTAVARPTSRREIHNHIGTVHAGALYTVGESATGAVVLGLFGDKLPGVFIALKEANPRKLNIKPTRPKMWSGRVKYPRKNFNVIKSRTTLKARLRLYFERPALRS